MTMRITVTNEDSNRTAVAVVEDVRPLAPGEYVTAYQREIAPGAKDEFWIHQGRRLRIEEKP